MALVHPENRKSVEKFAPRKSDGTINFAEAKTATAKVPPPPKIINSDVPDGVKGKKGRAKKIKKEFDIKSAVMTNPADPTTKISAVDAEGKLLVAIPEGYVIGEFKGLKKTNFARSCHFLHYRSEIIRARAARLTALADKMAANAKALESSTGSESEKVIKKVQKTLDVFEKLKKEAMAANPGMDWDTFLARMRNNGAAKAEEVK